MKGKTMTMSISDLLASTGGVPSAFRKDDPIGTVVTGKIVSAEVRQTTNYETGEPETWDDGNPKQQVRIVVQTGTIDPSVENDNGERAIYVKWWGDQRQALMQAVRAAGDSDIRPGGTFYAKYAGDKPMDNPRLSAAKVYEYAYEKPATGLDFTAPAEPAPAPAATPAASVTPVTPAPAAASTDTDKIQQLIGLGLSDAQINGATGADLTLIAALRAAASA